MAARKLAYGTRAAYGSVSNMNSLASGAAKTTQHRDNSTDLAIDYEVYVELTLNSTGVSATGTIELYLLESGVSGSGDTTDGIDMATPSTADVAASIKNAKLLAVLAANANNQIVRWQGRLRDFVANVPKFHGILVRNLSGAALAASGHDIQNAPITETIA